MKFFLLPFVLFTLAFTNIAHAHRADPFKGWYKVLTKTNAEDSQYVFVDVDTLGGIWQKYGEGPMPPSWEPHKDEPSILVAFTDRDTIFLALEKNSVIANGYLALQGAGTDILELGKRPDNNYNMGVKDNEVVSRYLLAPPTTSPQALKNRLLPTRLFE